MITKSADPLSTQQQDVAHNVQLPPFLKDVWVGDIAAVRASLKDNPERIASADHRAGLTALHIAVGRNDLEMTELLVEAGAAFVPDGEGRMPSTIAAELEVSEELADYICEAENRALQAQGQEDV